MMAGTTATRGFISRHRWLILRRVSQFGILLFFLLGPWFGLWWVKGNLSSSLTLDTLPLTDPYILLQSIFSGHLPEITAITGALIVTAFYMAIGGRIYCSWVCPVNIVTDLAAWMQDRLRLRTPLKLDRNMRYWVMAVSFILPLVTGILVWELVNPVSVIQRGLIFGIGMSWAIILAIFLFDLVISRRGWCGHLCPVGAFYSLLNNTSLLRVNAAGRADCDDCGLCFRVCPEAQIIKPALKPEHAHENPVILSNLCTNCGRCIDVCDQQVFEYGNRFSTQCREHDFKYPVSSEQ